MSRRCGLLGQSCPHGFGLDTWSHSRSCGGEQKTEENSGHRKQTHPSLSTHFTKQEQKQLTRVARRRKSQSSTRPRTSPTTLPLSHRSEPTRSLGKAHLPKSSRPKRSLSRFSAAKALSPRSSSMSQLPSRKLLRSPKKKSSRSPRKRLKRSSKS